MMCTEELPHWAKKKMIELFRTVIEQDIKMLDAAKAFNTKKTPSAKNTPSTTNLDTQALVCEKVDDEEEKDGDYYMEDVEFPRVRRFKLDKFLDQYLKELKGT